jgi:cyclopropane fatty-acyl-phospholipid synthase-like methyltransferase
MLSLSSLFFRITNNRIINNLLIWLHLDTKVVDRLAMYKRVRINTNLSAQEMAGFSKKENVQEAINKAHKDVVDTAARYVKPGGNVLDIGCGAGAYLIHFENEYNATGIDLNYDMIEKGKILVPKAEIIYDDFLKYPFNKKFDYIYSISVLEFIPPGRLDAFFAKIASLLNGDGILFLHYPHALNKKSLRFPDLYYIEYSPSKISETAGRYLEIVSHQHAFDGRTIELFDEKPYDPGTRTFKNGYLLIARKKGEMNPPL